MAKEMTEFNNRLDKLAEYCMNSGRFDQDLYIEYDVKRGLRDSNGKGILTGLTEISDVVAFKSVHGRKIPIDGQLYYQGYNRLLYTTQIPRDYLTNLGFTQER